MALSRLRNPLRLSLVTGFAAGLLPAAALPAAARPEGRCGSPAEHGNADPLTRKETRT